MAVEAQKLHVQIVDKKYNKEFRLYPASYTCNIIVREDPLMTLDEWLQEQEARNERYDKVIEKINALAREGTVYVFQDDMPVPNPTNHILWAKPIHGASDYVYVPEEATVINVYSSTPTSAQTGHVYMVDRQGNSNDLEETTVINILSSDPDSPEKGQWWVTDSGSSSALDPNDVTLGSINVVDTEPTSPSLGQVFYVKSE